MNIDICCPDLSDFPYEQVNLVPDKILMPKQVGKNLHGISMLSNSISDAKMTWNMYVIREMADEKFTSLSGIVRPSHDAAKNTEQQFEVRFCECQFDNPRVILTPAFQSKNMLK
jgi:hypothetical protein